MRASAYQGAAELLVKGDGTPRSRETIIAQVVTALEGAHEAGLAQGRIEARASVLREALAIARGWEQEAHAHRLILERELAECESVATPPRKK